jgi:hypothetical protein
MDTFVAFLIIAAMIGLVGVSWWVSNRVDNSEYDAETDSSEDSPSTDIPMSWVTQGRKQDEQRRGNAASSRSTIPGAERIDASLPPADGLAGLPGCFYAVALLVGIGLGITTIAVMSKGGNGELVCYMIGYTIGGVLSILATGRLIELVGRISDDVRAIRERTDSQK